MTEHAHLVLGTAGHIDHGKTSLVRALTGTDTDRLPEEKERGITIELGFAALDVGDLRVSIVDVPGHERFVRTMAAGAAGLDAVMLLVAADDGMMPQSREHLAICDLLGVRRGILVVTKADLVDEEMLELCTAELTEAVAGTFLEGAPVVVTSAETGRGLDELRGAIAQLSTDMPARSSAGGAVLPVDRVFSKAGFGAVVTGTLVHGSLAVGDIANLVPGGAELTVRGLQVHGQATERAAAGVRLAANLRGVSHHEVPRGAVLCQGGAAVATHTVHAAVTLLDDATLVENAEVSLSFATADVLARVVPLEVLDGKGRSLVRFVTHDEVAAWPGQRLVMRRPGAHGAATFGGGEVLDCTPVAYKGAFKTWQASARALADGDPGQKVLALVREARAEGIAQDALSARLPPGFDLDQALATLREESKVVAVTAGQVTSFVDSAIVEPLRDTVLERTRGFHRERPVLVGPAPGDIAAALPPTARPLCAAAIAALVDEGALLLTDGRVHDPARAPDPAAQKALDTARTVLQRAGLMPPLVDEWRTETGQDDATFADVVSELKRTGTAVQLASNLCFFDGALEQLASRVRGHFASQDALDTAAFKKIGGGLSRKHAIPLLEWLDKTGVTRRDGDVRRQGRS